MLDSEEFDRWSDSYDNDVNESDDRNVYPFAGYGEVICKIFDFVSKQGAVEILDGRKGEKENAGSQFVCR